VRGSLTLAAGVLTGNVIGFVRVALTAYLLGTHSRADSLAVALGPLDTLNSVLINSMVFAFVPMLSAREGLERAALFAQLRRVFVWEFLAISAAVVAGAPWLMRVLAPGLNPDALDAAINIARILALSTTAAGLAALYWALLYTERRFGPTAFFQATINICTILAAVALWREFGVYAFAVGYTLGACVQLVIAHLAARGTLPRKVLPPCPLNWRGTLAKPAVFLLYAAGLGLNVTFTRAYATQAGPGMAAAFEYCMRGVGVPMALLVNPLANSLLPEIARLKSLGRLREAFRLMDRTLLIAASIAIGGCAFALLLREPVIALVFQRGSFTHESTLMVSAVFLGLGPALVGWSLIEVASRSLFALNRPWPAVIAAGIPVLLNAALTLRFHLSDPHWIGAGASIGVGFAFLVLLVLIRWNRDRWLAEG
jgi:putative peptidoglycan lipid II flippase